MRWASTHTDQSSRRKAVPRLPILDRTPSRLEPEARTPAALLQRPAIWVASPTTLPLIMTHGWPGSVTELLEVVGPLTDPAAHGGRAEDAFDLVLPSLPGYGFSGEPTEVGWDVGRVARAWAELMNRLGYTRYVAQGGG